MPLPPLRLGSPGKISTNMDHYKHNILIQQ